MADEDPTELVSMRHPDTGDDTAVATREAFETIYKDKGYVLVDPDTGEPLDATSSSRRRRSTEGEG
jgi:hypothetical protein